MSHPFHDAGAGRRGQGSRAVARILGIVSVLASAACGSRELPAAEGRALVGPSGEVEWNRYHTNAEAVAIMEGFAALYPELARLDTIGSSWLGTPLVSMEITNQATGPAEEKPALYLDGGVHAQELTASEVALYAIAHLLNGYGSDPAVTHLLDTRAFYVRPKFNPDGSDLVLQEDQWLRSTVRPVDENGDGIPDSDPPEDLDGDGRILLMRVPDAEGNQVADPDDPRIMRSRTPDDPGPFYRLIREGRDSNGDGVINSDGIGGSDMNRNFPWNWGPAHVQSGAYNYPLSEPETRAAAEFVNAHRNIVQIIHGHTSGGFVYRLPSASDPAAFDSTDLALVLELGESYTRGTGRPVIPSATHPTERRYGTFISFAYHVYGIIGWVPEYWPGPSSWITDYDGDGEVTERDWHRANDEEFGGGYFTPWAPFDHPELGPVEIGGWHTKFWTQNPPTELLEEELRTQIPWILEMAASTPLISASEPRIVASQGDRFTVEVTVTNQGYLATHLTQRGAEGEVGPDGSIRHQIVRPILAWTEARGARPAEGNGRVRIGHLAGSNAHTDAVTERSTTVRWEMVRETPNAEIRIVIDAEKGGVARTGWTAVP